MKQAKARSDVLVQSFTHSHSRHERALSLIERCHRKMFLSPTPSCTFIVVNVFKHDCSYRFMKVRAIVYLASNQKIQSLVRNKFCAKMSLSPLGVVMTSKKLS
eukprot:Selendium_serpulae@DN4238_c0_g1_i3.p1